MSSESCCLYWVLVYYGYDWNYSLTTPWQLELGTKMLSMNTRVSMRTEVSGHLIAEHHTVQIINSCSCSHDSHRTSSPMTWCSRLFVWILEQVSLFYITWCLPLSAEPMVMLYSWMWHCALCRALKDLWKTWNGTILGCRQLFFTFMRLVLVNAHMMGIL